ncbi:MAG TPA: cell wall-binding protein, partial [Actinomycetes bacterium]|nr:cell wall-binding protein [Actinomycetes bacterium]
MIRRKAALTVSAALATCAVLASLAVTVPAAGATRAPLPERLAHLGESRQVVVVTAADWNTSHARLQTWQLGKSDVWHRRLGPVPARIGWSGFRRAANRLQNTGKTPAGTFDLLRGFGLRQPPGVDLPYRIVDQNDWWPYDPNDPKTYNVMQFHRVKRSHWRTDWAERLASYT